jgi:hypothetical protein
MDVGCGDEHDALDAPAGEVNNVLGRERPRPGDLSQLVVDEAVHARAQIVEP